MNIFENRNMKKLYLVIVTAMALAIVVAPTSAKTYKIATLSPDGLSWMRDLRTGVKQLEQITDGRVKFKIYPGGTMGDDATVLRKMRIGQLHGGVVAAGTLTRFYPDLQVYNLPLTFKTYDEVDYIRQRMDPSIINGLDDGGLVSFHLTETGFAYLLSKEPVTRVEDVRKLKAWIPDGDPIAAELIKAFGVSPIPLNLPDVLPALQTGIIDAVAVPPVVALALQWHNHVDYLLDLPLIYVYSMLAVDKKTYQRINPEDQELTQGVINGVFRGVDADSRIDNEKAYNALVSQGIKVTKPGPADLPAWEAIAKQSIGDLVASGEITGEIVETFNRHLSEYRKAAAKAAAAKAATSKAAAD
jgi:TRAP-type transport system periplasmic protein